MVELDRTCGFVAIAVVLMVPAAAAASEEIAQEDRQFFEAKIRPVLVEHCYECHSHEADTLSSDYALDTRDGLRGGGATGDAAIVPGDPAASRLLQALRYTDDAFQMPPDEKLPDHVIADFERWIARGAPDPRLDDPETLRRNARAADAAELWSFRPPVAPEIPEVRDPSWPRSPIDRFILSELDAVELRPVADADPRELLRRVAFDLIGLPPDPELVESFAAESTPAAFASIVDELLDSTHFGERWGRHWLDLARYAESSGMEFNFTYPHAWPYRDYVIDSINNDKPYDRFVTEQLAGDLLPAASEAERVEHRLATGFLAVGPKRHNAGKTEFRMDVVDDQIRTASEAFLGLTIGCARCHDHKFDPIPTEDYYALAGIFLSTETLHGTIEIQYSRHPTALIAFGPEAEERDVVYRAWKDQLSKAEKQLTDKQNGLKKLKGQEKKRATAELEDLKNQVKQLRQAAPVPPRYGMGAADSSQPADTHIAIGGNPANKGALVPRGFLSTLPVNFPSVVKETGSGRLELAHWIASPDNPLTARVIVNRVWHHLFGRGLVPTVNNFGVLGEPPSHPELLDYMAVRLMDDGWSLKSLIRSVVLSRVYQLSTRGDDQHLAVDPHNRLLWRMTPRRLEVEPLRDAILTVSGRLDVTRPEGSSVTPLGQQLARAVSWEQLNPPSAHRTVYLPVVRHYTSHMLQEFDFAASSLVVGDRSETTTSQQALFFLNDDFILEQSAATAARLMAEHPGDLRAQLSHAYLRALSRRPTPNELETAVEFVERVSDSLMEGRGTTGRRETGLAAFVQAIFGSAEFRYLIHAAADNESAPQILTEAASR